jgi:hypothetical protein
VVLGAFVACGLLISYQLAVIVVHPPWIKPATDWLRAALAWPQFFVVAWVAVHLRRTHHPTVMAWGFGALAMLSYAVARSTWTIADLYLYPHGVPFPTLPDLFFILQYPFFIAGVFLMSRGGRWLSGVRSLVDAVLWMSSITALTWYFVLKHIAAATGESRAGQSISMYYQVADLVLFYGVAVALTRSRRTARDQMTVYLLCAAFVALFVADTWAAVLLIYPPYTYPTGGPPDVFWFSCYLLIPLAAVVALRLAPELVLYRPAVPPVRVALGDLWAGLLFVLPSMVAAGASLVIMVTAAITSPTRSDLMVPLSVGSALLVLATIRPAVLFVEQRQLLREREAARDQEVALRLANQRMEEFLGVVSHEV